MNATDAARITTDQAAADPNLPANWRNLTRAQAVAPPAPQARAAIRAMIASNNAVAAKARTLRVSAVIRSCKIERAALLDAYESIA